MLIKASLLPKRDKSNIDLTLSVSKVKTFEDCKAKYKFRYIKRLPKIERDFHIFGKFLHQILENFYAEILKDPQKKKDWKDVLKYGWDSAYTEYSDKITGEQFKEASLIIETYSSVLDEEGLPNVTHVEKPFYINLNNKVLLNGFIDCVQMDDDGVVHVADYKTTKDPKYLKDFFQLMTYSYALMLEDENLNRIRSSFVLLRHNFDYITQEYTRDEVISVAEKFLESASLIEDEKVWRPSPHFLCKYCDYLDHCKPGNDFLIKRGVIKKKPFVGIRSW